MDSELRDLPTQYKNGFRPVKCRTCEHDHAYGVVRKDRQGINLYGAEKCGKCACNDFIDATVPVLAKADYDAYWEMTEFLSPQTPLETRIAIGKILSLGKFTDQWPEFMGLMLSQGADVRAALTKDDNKFAHLVAHTEEFLKMAENVAQLGQRVEFLNGSIGSMKLMIDEGIEPVVQLMERIDGRLDDIANRVTVIEAKRSWWRRIFGK